MQTDKENRTHTFKKLIRVERGGIEESAHRGLIAVADNNGHEIASVGDSDQVVFARSTAKPLQALPLVMHGGVERFGLTDEELAVICSSHSGQSKHTALVQSILHKCGLDVGRLRCGVHTPWDEATARRLIEQHETASALHNNCSGKHAGMLALCRLLDADLDTYMQPDHPVQKLMRETIAEFCDLHPSQLATGTDGCGVPVYAMPIQKLATAMARLAAPERLPHAWQAACRTLFAAMANAPELVAGAGRLETTLMKATAPRIVAKSGAEGLLALMIADKQWGIVIKIEDGSGRGLLPAAIETLRQLGVLDEQEQQALSAYHHAPLRNVAGAEVGQIRSDFRLRISD